ncbi:hypothetical protein [Anaeromicropila populeti]|uniref:Uncharacterized protein n=1 Tax=Anaeromicropila populeti TaxID=37658 RepID=A0A1I6JYV4_9FIRM|nr:hypothetical protein [Anaeromicropila populeti]SFR84134.1 hypothetical protein SAMN05661086_02099 [Anaeromicropila populeti]
MREKKIVLFLVEGKSDVEALETIFEVIFEHERIKFEIIKTDITADENIGKNNIDSVIISKIDKFLEKNPQVTASDILQIIQLTDMDGAGVAPEKVLKSKNQVTSYTLDFIYAKDRNRMIARNIRKRDILSFLIKKTYIIKQIPNKENDGIVYKLNYRIYYFSRNLEHVLYNIVEEVDKNRKVQLAEQFSDQYIDREKEFILYINNPEIKVSGDYVATWKFIMQGCHSLHRKTNVGLIFKEFIYDE